jgi:hypothetical protein
MPEVIKSTMSESSGIRTQDLPPCCGNCTRFNNPTDRCWLTTQYGQDPQPTLWCPRHKPKVAQTLELFMGRQQ